GVLDDAEDGEAYYALVQALVLARAGREDEAGRILAEVDLAEARALTDRATSGQIKPTPVVAATLAALGRAEEASVFLEEAMQEDPMVLLYDRCYPELQALEADPRYRQLLRRTGVPGV
ncbi:MAG TPA: hypothetical protein VK858_21480, partial [Longimicrobiales bacterium]|nr:hypothetical protein [Longimicrobiales bacterium]